MCYLGSNIAILFKEAPWGDLLPFPLEKTWSFFQVHKDTAICVSKSSTEWLAGSRAACWFWMELHARAALAATRRGKKLNKQGNCEINRNKTKPSPCLGGVGSSQSNRISFVKRRHIKAFLLLCHNENFHVFFCGIWFAFIFFQGNSVKAKTCVTAGEGVASVFPAAHSPVFLVEGINFR